MKIKHLAVTLAAGLCASAALAEGSLRDEFLAGPCVVSIAQGRNLSKEDPKANDFWNRINASLQKFLEERLIENKVVLESDFYGVEAADYDARWKGVATLANKKRCPFLLQLGAYAERPNELTVHVAVNRMSYDRSEAARGTHVSFGAQVYERDYKYDTTGDFGRTFIFSEVARRYAEDLLAAAPKP